MERDVDQIHSQFSWLHLSWFLFIWEILTRLVHLWWFRYVRSSEFPRSSCTMYSVHGKIRMGGQWRLRPSIGVDTGCPEFSKWGPEGLSLSEIIQNSGAPLHPICTFLKKLGARWGGQTDIKGSKRGPREPRNKRINIRKNGFWPRFATSRNNGRNAWLIELHS